jgi:hypothetical protein
MSSTTAAQGYEEAVIVPATLYRELKKNITKNNNPLTATATGQPNPDQRRWELMETGRFRQAGVVEDNRTRRITDLVRQYASAVGRVHPFLQKIIDDYVDRFSSQINWRDTTYELIIDGATHADTNIIRALHFLLAPEDLNYRTPPGAIALAEKLSEIGVPRGWFVAPTPQNKVPTAEAPSDERLAKKVATTPAAKAVPIMPTTAPVKEASVEKPTGPTEKKTAEPRTPLGSVTKIRTPLTEPGRRNVAMESIRHNWASAERKQKRPPVAAETTWSQLGKPAFRFFEDPPEESSVVKSLRKKTRPKDEEPSSRKSNRSKQKWSAYSNTSWIR